MKGDGLGGTFSSVKITCEEEYMRWFQFVRMRPIWKERRSRRSKEEKWKEEKRKREKVEEESRSGKKEKRRRGGVRGGVIEVGCPSPDHQVPCPCYGQIS